MIEPRGADGDYSIRASGFPPTTPVAEHDEYTVSEDELHALLDRWPVELWRETRGREVFCGRLGS